MAIADLMNSPGDSTWYDRLWYHTVEDNLNELLNIRNLAAYSVEPINHVHFNNDFYGYLRENGYNDKRYWYPILRVNQMTSPLEFNWRYDYILIPNLSVVDALHELYLSSISRTN